MTTHDIMKSLDGVEIHEFKDGGIYGVIPWMGVVWSASSANAPISDLAFIIDKAEKVETGTPNRISRFKGTFDNRISLASAHQLTKDFIVNSFGEPQDQYNLHTTPNDQLRSIWQELQESINKGRSVVSYISQNTEVLYYPSRGFHCAIENNRVHVLNIVKPTARESDN